MRSRRGVTAVMGVVAAGMLASALAACGGASATMTAGAADGGRAHGLPDADATAGLPGSLSGAPFAAGVPSSSSPFPPAAGSTASGVPQSTASGGVPLDPSAPFAPPLPSLPSSTVSSSSPGTTRSPVPLAGWRLILPVDAHGQTTGDAATADRAVPVPPFLVRAADGSLRFWAPDGGAHTPNSTHPRSELVRDTDFLAARSGRHSMTATMAVNQVTTLPAPSAPTVVIGQLHGGGAISAAPFVLVRYRYDAQSHAGTVDFGVDQSMGAGHTATQYPLLTGVPLNTPITFTLTDNGDATLTVSATAPGAGGRTVTAPVPAVFQNADVRFSAGDYSQSVGPGPAGDGGRVTCFALSAS